MSKLLTPLLFAAGLSAQVAVHIQPVPVSPSSFLRARLSGVTVLGANNAWAVGEVNFYDRNRGGYVDETYALHWDGRLWRRVPTPSPKRCSNCVRTRSRLYAIDAISATDIWAGGSFDTRHPTSGFVGDQMLLLHYDGKSWKHIPPVFPRFGSPHQSSSGTRIEAIEAISTKDVWFFGFWSGDPNIPRGALALHYDGSQFRFHKMPWAGNGYVSFYAADSAGPNEVWAVGKSGVLFRQGQETFVMRWNGSSWTRMHPPASSSLQYRLTSVLVRSSKDVWISGYEQKPSQYTTAVPYVVHWDGSKFTRTKAPGFIPNLVDAGGSVLGVGTKIHLWTGTAWKQIADLKRPRALIEDAAAVGPNDVFLVGLDGPNIIPLAARLEPASRGTATPRFPCKGGPVSRTLHASTIGRIGTGLVVGVDDLYTKAFPAPSRVYWLLGTRPLAPCGVVLPGFGYAGRGTELLVAPNSLFLALGPATRSARGAPAYFSVPIPKDPRLPGLQLTTQAVFFHSSSPPAFSAALDFRIGR